jgi:hypothetical protein
MSTLRNLGPLFGAVAAMLLAWACERPERAVDTRAAKPRFWFGAQCPAAKMTGGGRIDAPLGGPEKNPPASHQFQTFGAHVISDGLAPDGTCPLKGQLQWVDHRDEMRVNGRPLNLHSEQITFVEELLEDTCKDGALHWGGRLVEKNTGEEYDFEVFDCDNGEPGAEQDGFNIALAGPGESLDGYTLNCPSPPSIHPDNICTLTGGNRQFHPTH